jgi:hypothetical protein
MGLGQLPPQSAAPVVINVAAGLRVEVFLDLEFRGYFADIRARSGSAGRGLARSGAPATIEPQSKGQKANNLIQTPPRQAPAALGNSRADRRHRCRLPTY